MAIQKAAFRDHKNPRDVRGTKCLVLGLTQRKGGATNGDTLMPSDCIGGRSDRRGSKCLVLGPTQRWRGATYAIGLHWWEVRPQGFKVSCIGSYTEVERNN